MTALLDLAQERIAAVDGYRPGKAAPLAEGKLSSNESPFGPSLAVRAAVAAAAAHTSLRYPDAAEVRALVAAAAGVATDQVVLGNGSDELCYRILAAARAALADPGWADYVVHLVRRERARLETLLDELGWPYHPSQANFVTMLPLDPAGLLQALAGDGIALRDGRDLGLGGWLRASIGSPARMHVLRSALSRWSQEAT